MTTTIAAQLFLAITIPVKRRTTRKGVRGKATTTMVLGQNLKILEND